MTRGVASLWWGRGRVNPSRLAVIGLLLLALASALFLLGGCDGELVPFLPTEPDCGPRGCV